MKLKLNQKDNAAIRSVIEKYRNPVFDLNWLCKLLNPDHCLLCKMYFTNYIRCDHRCPIIELTGEKCSKSYYYRRIFKYQRKSLQDFNCFEWEVKNIDRRNYKKLIYWLSKAADKLEESFLIRPKPIQRSKK